MRTKTKIIATITTLVAASMLVALPAFADPPSGGGTGQHARPSFPIAAAEFKQHVDARTAKMRERVEERAKTLPADKATELRTNFNASVTKMNAEVAKAIADGKVTEEEAKAVRAASPHKGKGGAGGKCEHKSGTKA